MKEDFASDGGFQGERRVKPTTKNSRCLVFVAVFLALACIGLLIGVIVLATRQPPEPGKEDDKDKDKDAKVTTAAPDEDPDAPDLSIGEYRFASVSSENEICNKIGTDILAKKGGSAVDAAIATLLCVGVVSPHYSGIGGGFLMTIYDKSKQDTEKKVRALVAREVAPLAATEDMYINSTLSSKTGGGAIGVPTELAGYWKAWEDYGKLSWKTLLQPAIQLAKSHKVSGSLAKYIKEDLDIINEYPNLKAQFVKPSGEPYKEGDEIKMPQLEKTLTTIADEGASAFYTGSLVSDIIADLNDAGSIITAEDLAQYQPFMKDPVVTDLTINGKKYKVYGPPPPSSGVIVQFILNILNGYGITKDTPPEKVYHWMIEAFKFAYGKRSLLGDEEFVNVTEWKQKLTSADFVEQFKAKIDDSMTSDNVTFYEPAFDVVTDEGTSQVCVLAADGSAVSVTSTINLHFGSKVRGNRTGIIFNDEMDDFSTPGTSNSFGIPSSPQNYIQPKKSPMSSMSPSLLIDDDDIVRLSVGSAGGSRIITAIVQTLLNSLYLGRRIDEAVGFPRLHHQLLPDVLRYEEGFPQDVLDSLKQKGHNVEPGSSSRWFGGAMAITNKCGSMCEDNDDDCEKKCIKATADWRAEEDARKGPMPDGY